MLTKASRRKPLIADTPISANQNSAMINPRTGPFPIINYPMNGLSFPSLRLRIKAEAARNREFSRRRILFSEDNVGGNLAQ